MHISTNNVPVIIPLFAQCKGQRAFLAWTCFIIRCKWAMRTSHNFLSPSVIIISLPSQLGIRYSKLPFDLFSGSQIEFSFSKPLRASTQGFWNPPFGAML